MRFARQRHQWRVRGAELQLGTRTMVMGVLNVAQEGSSKGLDPDVALEQALALQEQGADLIDVNIGVAGLGAERTQPTEELRRMVPVLRKLRHNLSVPLSINTYNAETAERALELGAQIINDVSGLSFDARLARVVGQSDAGLILTHLRSAPVGGGKLAAVPDLISLIGRDLKSALDRALDAGIDRRRIVLDPGLELGKRGIENFQILSNLERFTPLQQPLLVCPSHKTFITGSLRASDEAFLFGTAAAVTAAVCMGAHIVRVHDVEAIKLVVQVADRFHELPE
jgi:dihydropteroate synthase